MSIAVVDSGYGNLRSVERALAHVGGKPVVTGDPDVITNADRVVVPGQGAFTGCMRALQARGLEQALRGFVATGRPFLGICLGLQILFDTSEEQSDTDDDVLGLGIIAGDVKRLPAGDHKVPHMGWNQVRLEKDDPLLGADGDYYYFVHSYFVTPDDSSVTVASCDYATRFCAAIRHENLFACQFHPEKSQQAGLSLLRRFVTV